MASPASVTFDFTGSGRAGIKFILNFSVRILPEFLSTTVIKVSPG